MLPDRCRLIYKLVREDGMKYKQISKILGISVRTIDAQISIASKRITEALKKYLN
jgi:RNA polymerase sigma-70 factor (ECF subfamily)